MLRELLQKVTKRDRKKKMKSFHSKLAQHAEQTMQSTCLSVILRSADTPQKCKEVRDCTISQCHVMEC